jgi:hypothetical protein
MYLNSKALTHFIENSQDYPSPALDRAVIETNYHKIETDIWYESSFKNMSDEELDDVLDDLDTNHTRCLEWLSGTFGKEYVDELKNTTFTPLNILRICVDEFNEFLEFPLVRNVTDPQMEYVMLFIETKFHTEFGCSIDSRSGLDTLPEIDCSTDIQYYINKYGLYIALGAVLRGFFTWNFIVKNQ